jgi:hypothetical protein
MIALTAVLVTSTFFTANAALWVAEPNTRAPFAASIEVDGETLHLTGADYRRALGRDAYALAHYASAEARDAMAGLPENERLDFLTAHSGPKAVILHGVYSSIPARGIRWSWRKSFRRIDAYDDTAKSFIDLFDSSFKRDSRLEFIAAGDGAVRIVLDGRTLGEWQNDSLANALWAICLGKEADLENRDNLTRTDHLVPAEAPAFAVAQGAGK